MKPGRKIQCRCPFSPYSDSESLVSIEFFIKSVRFFFAAIR
jgi:hypothetical protein